MQQFTQIIKDRLFHRYALFPTRTELTARLFYQSAFADFDISPTEINKRTTIENLFSPDGKESALVVVIIFETQGVEIHAFTISGCKTMFLFAADTPEALSVLTQMKLMYA